VHGLGWNRRGPSAQPASGKDWAYKPMVKSPGVQRESEGVVVPAIGVQHNAPGGKGPHFDHAGGEGKREGMAGFAWSNYPGGSRPAVAVDGKPSDVKVRQLQRRLWAAARQSEARRFHALFDRVCRGDVLWEAWERVKANRGAAGVDRITLAFVQEEYGVARMLGELQADLRAGTYRPAPARRVDIPKPDGSKRPLGIPAVRDRVAQQAAKLVLEPIFEAGFAPCSYGFRPRRSATQAMERTVAGTPQGGVISPLLANIYLHVLDTEFARRGLGELVRYADDGVVLCCSAAQAGAALDAVGQILASLGLRLHPDKTKVVDLRQGREGLDFLGCHFHARMSGRLWAQRRIVRYYLHRWPSQQAMKRLSAKVRARTGRNRVGADIREVIADLNPLLRGWGNYFRTGNAATKFRQADRYVAWRLQRLLIKKRGRNLRAGQADQWTEEWLHGLGLHKLSGTVRYPKAA